MYKVIKRILDVILASCMLVVFAPVLLLSMVILMFTGEKEIFYFQERIGYKNQAFKIWKFATMLKNSPNLGTKQFTLRNDSRITSFGKFLRRTKINELPQIFNVLIGNMSIVGPRPLVQASIDFYPTEIQSKIYNQKPGITGIGSIVFRDEEKLLSEAKNPQEMYAKIYLYKGELEMWYQKKYIFDDGWEDNFINDLDYCFFYLKSTCLQGF